MNLSHIGSRFVGARAVTVVVVMFAVASGTVASQLGGGAVVSFPDDYREWVHVKSALVSARHPDFKRAGGFRHIYANPKALSGYRTGVFPQGAVIAVDWIDGQDADGMFTEGARQRLDVMVKDASRFSATGGWGFERFAGVTRERIVTDVTAQCVSCHAGPDARDMVFSRWRE